MWMTPHTLVGIAIATQIPDPLISLPLAYASHYLMDAVPHWTQGPSFRGTKGVALYVDFGIALSIGLLAAFQYHFGSVRFWITIAAAALANLPDALRIPALIKTDKLPKTKGFDLHGFLDQDVASDRSKLLFKFLQGKVWFGILTQALVVAFCLWLIFVR